MSRGPSSVTSVTSSEPPEYLVPGIKAAAGAAGNAFNTLNGGGGPQQPYSPPAQQYDQQYGGSQWNRPSQWRYDDSQPDWTGQPVPPTGNTGAFRPNGPWSQASRQSQGGLGEPGSVHTNPLSPVQREGQGLDALFNRGAQGSPVMGAANNLTQSVLQGDYLSPDSNPYLQQTFNRAADLTRGRLDSEFAGSGRNLGAARPARSDELQTLASNIYGQNFQAERDRMSQAVGQASGLQNADFQNIQAMIDAGSFPLDQYINRLGGLIPGAGGVTQSTQPVFRTGLF